MGYTLLLSYMLVVMCSEVFCKPGNAPDTGLCRKATVFTLSGDECVFPFLYDGVWYDSCTAIHSPQGVWCATTPIYTLNDWDYCIIQTYQDQNDSRDENNVTTCMIPFLYNGDNVFKCVSGGRSTNEPWCLTSEDAESWGYCILSHIYGPCALPPETTTEELSTMTTPAETTTITFANTFTTTVTTTTAYRSFTANCTHIPLWLGLNIVSVTHSFTADEWSISLACEDGFQYQAHKASSFASYTTLQHVKCRADTGVWSPRIVGCHPIPAKVKDATFSTPVEARYSRAVGIAAIAFLVCESILMLSLDMLRYKTKLTQLFSSYYVKIKNSRHNKLTDNSAQTAV